MTSPILRGFVRTSTATAGLVPGRMGVIDCDETHRCKGAHPCVVMDEMCNALFHGALR